MLLTNITPKDVLEIKCSTKPIRQMEVRTLVMNHSSNSSNVASSRKNLIKNDIWKLDGDTLQTSKVKYGFERESAAVKQNEIQTRLSVSSTGLWLNPQFSQDCQVQSCGLVFS